MIKPKLLTASGGDTDLYIGEKEYLEAGEFEFQVPLGIRRIHACLVGAGTGCLNDADGGGAGGLAWANNIEVEPGEIIKVKVGAVVDGGYSNSELIKADDTLLIRAEGGKGRQGGGFVFGDGVSGGGGNGGYGTSRGSSSSGGTTYGTFYGSGGGAGGYMGSGGNSNVYGATAAEENSGGGSGASRYYITSGVLQGVISGAPGGGVGINGIGATGGDVGDQGADNNARAGIPGSGGVGAKYGAGSSGREADGGHGAVRIIWGINFRYPDKATL